MKRFILLVMAVTMLTVSLSSVLCAQEDDMCPCGADEETGECLPCPEE